MKRTKKSLIIAPALGVLLLASVGSVSGTVAWFSSVSTFNTDVSEFAVTRLDGNLQCTMGAGSGTYLDDGEVKVGETNGTVGVKLTHASFDHTASAVYTVSSEAAGGYRDVTEHLVAKEIDATHKIYWAVNWTMDFSYKFALESAVNLYFDNAPANAGSAIRATNQDGGAAAAATNATWLGFRVAFIGMAAGADGSTTTTGSSGQKKVWADQQTTAKCTYVSSTGTNTYNDATAYNQNPATDLISSQTAAAKPEEGTKQPASGTYFLGQFSNNSGAVTTAHIKFTCWAWFEGTDENVVDDAEMDTVIASMKFYTRESSN